LKKANDTPFLVEGVC